jgi:lipopolysaccharide transport system permease protein
MNLNNTAQQTKENTLRKIYRHHELIIQLARREVMGRYRGSLMGLAWSFITPLLMLAVYTTFFTVAYSARIGEHGSNNHAEFAIALFVGLMIHGFFSECINRAPNLIVGNVNYVKKVVFPLEILPIVSGGAALFHCVISLSMLLAVQMILNHTLSWTIIFFPVVMAPFVLIVLGGVWFLSAVGVYLRDISNLTGLLATVLLFLSPVFYAVDSLPAKIQPWIMLNPLTFIIEQSRAVLLYNAIPDWNGLAIYTAVSLIVASVGLWCFQKLRGGFSDVL